MKKILLGIVFLCITKIEAGSLGGSGSNYRAYQPYHNIFYDQQSAWGGVRMANGFTVTVASGVGRSHGSSVYMDTCLSVSGYIDLRNTNTMILRSDLKLDSGASFSSSGKIYGKNVSLILNGNLNLPNNIVLHFDGNMAIQGNGNTLNLGENSQIFVDTDATLTLRNLIISNSKNGVGNPAIKLASSGSQLALDNSILDMTGDFYFDRGSMFIHNDVIFTGTNALIYRSCQPSFITSGATLMFDLGTTFSLVPATFTDCQYSVRSTYTSNNFIKMTDSSSNLYLNGCSFMTTLTGCLLTNGALLFDNKVSLFSNASNTISSEPLTKVGSEVTVGSYSANGTWSPDGRYFAISDNTNLYIYSFDRVNTPSLVVTQPLSGAALTAMWSSDGNFIAVAGYGVSTIKIFKFDKPGTLTLIGSNVFTSVAAAPWSPDGKFIAAISYAGTSYLKIFRFTGVGKLIELASTSVGASCSFVSWSPDGKFLTISVQTSNNMQVYKFTEPNTLTKIGDSVPVTYAFNAQWSPDGRFIATVCNAAGTGLLVHSFDGSTTPRVAASVSVSGNIFDNLAWSPNGRFIAIAGVTIGEIRIYEFDGFNTLKFIGRMRMRTTLHSLAWSPDGNYIFTSTYTTPSYMQMFKVNYIVDRAKQAMSNSIAFGNSSVGSSYDLNVRLFSGSQVEVDGLVNYDNVG